MLISHEANFDKIERTPKKIYKNWNEINNVQIFKQHVHEYMYEYMRVN